MRNCVLSIMGEMVVHVLSKDGAGEKEKATRDQFFDRLEVSPKTTDTPCVIF